MSRHEYLAIQFTPNHRYKIGTINYQFLLSKGLPLCPCVETGSVSYL
ncbi:MAG: hypothetical protein JWM28_3456 [Chitinophagaceae bacterium]|nr:hypothetical protein [Chitinophagaceae bacterium]